VTDCRQVMLEELQRRNFAPTTISSYLHAVEQFARHFRCRPDQLNQTHLRSYQAYLLHERKMRPLTVRLHVAMPPAPICPVISYGPSRVPGANDTVTRSNYTGMPRREGISNDQGRCGY
jgi:integrase-like protein